MRTITSTTLSLAAAALLCSTLLTPNASAEDRVSRGTKQSSALPEYHPAVLPTASLTSVGSDSMDDLVHVWVDAYRKHQPAVTVQVVSRGSATAPAALIEGSADIGPMSRPMKTVERADFVAKYGFAPTQVRTAQAAIGVYVPKDNPLKKISFEELEQMYASPEDATAASRQVTWDAFGVTTAQLKQTPVAPVARAGEGYLQGYFRQAVLHQRPFAAGVMNTSDAAAMFETIKMNPNSIAFGEVLPVADGVRLIPVSRSLKEQAVMPTKKTLSDESYPLTRYLSIYVVREPNEKVDPSVSDFLRFVLSREGQQLVEANGLIPLTAEVAKAEIKKLQ